MKIQYKDKEIEVKEGKTIQEVLEEEIKASEYAVVGAIFNNEYENLNYEIHEDGKVELIDNGVGISKEDLEHIWDRYYKASDSFTRQVQGSGLGLSIVKNILIKHSSDFGVESELGKGSNFWLDLERISKKDMDFDKNKNN